MMVSNLHSKKVAEDAHFHFCCKRLAQHSDTDFVFDYHHIDPKAHEEKHHVEAKPVSGKKTSPGPAKKAAHETTTHPAAGGSKGMFLQG